MTLLLLCGTSAAIAFNGGVLNLGIDGQLYMGAMAATVAGIYGQNIPHLPLILLCMLAGALAGSLWGVFAGFLNVKCGANMVVITLMMNYIATLFTEWCIFTPLYTEAGVAAKSTANIAQQAHLSVLIPGTQVTTALFAALLVLVAAAVWIQYTASGFETRIVDKNPLFASTMGISVGKKTLVLMLASGAVAGLAGALEIIGVQHRFVSSFISGVGFDGMVVSMLAGNNMLLLPVAAFFMGVMESGSASLEMFAGIPRAMAEVLMGIIILFVTVDLKRPKEFLTKMLGYVCSPGPESARRSR